MTTLEKAGAIAAVVAAVAAIVGVGLSWFYGSRSRADAKATLRYERLAEVRRLVGEIRRHADNGHWSQVSAFQGQLRSALKNVQLGLPVTSRLAEVEWGLVTYESEGLQSQSEAARAEIDDAAR